MTQLEPVIVRTAADIIALHGEVRARVKSLFATTDREIDAVLTPEQKVQFEKIKKKRPAPPE